MFISRYLQIKTNKAHISLLSPIIYYIVHYNSNVLYSGGERVDSEYGWSKADLCPKI